MVRQRTIWRVRAREGWREGIDGPRAGVQAAGIGRGELQCVLVGVPVGLLELVGTQAFGGKR